jgi:hypothetical protein
LLLTDVYTQQNILRPFFLSGSASQNSRQLATESDGSFERARHLQEAKAAGLPQVAAASTDSIGLSPQEIRLMEAASTRSKVLT